MNREIAFDGNIFSRTSIYGGIKLYSASYWCSCCGVQEALTRGQKIEELMLEMPQGKQNGI